MAFYGDPARLEGLAREIDGQAMDLRRKVASLGYAAASARWQSMGADRFQSEAAVDCARLNDVAAGFEHAAAELRAHAATVRRRLAEIAAIEAAAVHYFRSVASTLHHAASSVLHAAADGVSVVRHAVEHTIEHPPWSGWPWRPTTLPPSGDMEWLTVGSFLQSKGVL